MVEGLVSYDETGEPVNIDVKSIMRINGKKFALENLYDEDFTKGLSVKEYQDRLREGKLDDD